jgi:hypothetical protein
MSAASVPAVPDTRKALVTVNVPVLPVKSAAAFVPGGTADETLVKIRSTGPELTIAIAGAVVDEVEIELL